MCLNECCNLWISLLKFNSFTCFTSIKRIVILFVFGELAHWISCLAVLRKWDFNIKFWHWTGILTLKTLYYLFCSGYKFDFEKKVGKNISAGTLSVEQYGVKGHISSNFWDDTDASVFCKSQGFKYGFMYQQSPDSFHKDPPITVGDFNCTGTEPSLLNCSFNSRFNLGNNTFSNRAGVVCYSQSGGCFVDVYMYIC